MKKNVLFVVDERKMGGVSILLNDILHMINLKSFNIDVLILHDSGEMLEHLPKEVNIIIGTTYFNTVDLSLKEALKSKNIKTIINKLTLIIDMKTGLIKRKIIRERKKILSKIYDVEIAFKDGFTALFTSFGNSKRKIHWLHYEYKKNNPNSKYNRTFQKALPNFDQIIGVSNGVIVDFNNIYHLEKKTKVIANLINVERILEQSKEKCEIELDSDIFNMISIGRLHKAKGYDRLIEVFHQLNQENLLEDAILRIYGPGNELGNLNLKIKCFGLEDKIKLMGEIKNPYKYLRGNDLTINASHIESFGLTIVESMLLGVPVLATSTAATNTLINNGSNGKVVNNSAEGLLVGLKEILENKEIVKKYHESLKKYNYNNAQIIKQIEGVLKCQN